MTVEERDDIETGNQDPDEEPSRQRKEQRKKNLEKDGAWPQILALCTSLLPLVNNIL